MSFLTIVFLQSSNIIDFFFLLRKVTFIHLTDIQEYLFISIGGISVFLSLVPKCSQATYYYKPDHNHCRLMGGNPQEGT